MEEKGKVECGREERGRLEDQLFPAMWGGGV